MKPQHARALVLMLSGAAIAVAARRSSRPTQSVLSYRSPWSILSSTSVLSIASAASLLSIGSFASVLSIGSSHSVLSIGSDGGFLSIGSSESRRRRSTGAVNIPISTRSAPGLRT